MAGRYPNGGYRYRHPSLSPGAGFQNVVPLNSKTGLGFVDGMPPGEVDRGLAAIEKAIRDHLSNPSTRRLMKAEARQAITKGLTIAKRLSQMPYTRSEKVRVALALAMLVMALAEILRWLGVLKSLNAFLWVGAWALQRSCPLLPNAVFQWSVNSCLTLQGTPGLAITATTTKGAEWFVHGAFIASQRMDSVKLYSRPVGTYKGGDVYRQSVNGDAPQAIDDSWFPAIVPEITRPLEWSPDAKAIPYPLQPGVAKLRHLLGGWAGGYGYSGGYTIPVVDNPPATDEPGVVPVPPGPLFPPRPPLPIPGVDTPVPPGVIPVPVNPPVVVPQPAVVITPYGAKIGVQRHALARAGFGHHEVKIRVQTPPGVAGFINFTTEYTDWINALYGALPAELQTADPRSNVPESVQKSQLVVNNLDKVDILKALRNIAVNEAGDNIYGAAGQQSAKAAQILQVPGHGPLWWFSKGKAK